MSPMGTRLRVCQAQGIGWGLGWTKGDVRSCRSRWCLGRVSWWRHVLWYLRLAGGFWPNDMFSQTTSDFRRQTFTWYTLFEDPEWKAFSVHPFLLTHLPCFLLFNSSVPFLFCFHLSFFNQLSHTKNHIVSFNQFDIFYFSFLTLKTLMSVWPLYCWLSVRSWDKPHLLLTLPFLSLYCTCRCYEEFSEFDSVKSFFNWHQSIFYLTIILSCLNQSDM